MVDIQIGLFFLALIALIVLIEIYTPIPLVGFIIGFFVDQQIQNLIDIFFN